MYMIRSNIQQKNSLNGSFLFVHINKTLSHLTIETTR